MPEAERFVVEGWGEWVWCGANIMQSLKIRSYKLNLEAEG